MFLNILLETSHDCSIATLRVSQGGTASALMVSSTEMQNLCRIRIYILQDPRVICMHI